MRVDIFRILFFVILISVLTLYTVQTFEVVARLRDGRRFHRFPPVTTKSPIPAGHNGNHHPHPIIDLEEGHNVQNKMDQRKKLPTHHLQKKRTYKVMFFDTEGDSIHLSSEMAEEIKEEVQIDPENRASNHQSTSDAASTSEEVPEIESMIPVQNLIENAEKWGFHSAEKK